MQIKSNIQMSIIISVYNVEKYIEATLNSIFQQSANINDFEVLVVNDGTKDNSMTLVDSFCQKYFNITIINQDNKGLSEARNAGLNIAQGKYVWFVDSDDTIANNSLEKMIGFAKENVYDIVVSSATYKDERTQIITTKYACKSNKLDNQVFERLKYLNQGMPSVLIQQLIIRRKLLLSHSIIFHKGVFHEDMEFFVKIVFFAKKIFISNQIIYNYLIRKSGSITSEFNIKRLYDCLEIARELEKFRNLHAKEKMERKLINARILYMMIYSVLLYCNHMDFISMDFKIFVKQNRNRFKDCRKYLLAHKRFRFYLFCCGLLISIHPVLFFYAMKMKLHYSQYKNILK
jgi:glycosyltransferase involved in cell wall biosynthesis